MGEQFVDTSQAIHDICYIYYPPEVRRGEYLGLGVFLLQYFPLVKILKLLHCICNEHEYDWVVKIRNTSEAFLRPQYSPWP